MGLQDEHVVGVGVHREALGAGRREVGVGLAGVAELELELGDEVGDRGPVALEPLQHDGGALVVQAHQLHRVDQPGERLAGQAAAAGEGRLGEHRPVVGDPDGGGADRRLGQQVVDVGERQHRLAERGVGAVDVDRRRPDLVDEGLGVTGQPVECAQERAVRAVGAVGVRRVAVRRVGRVAVGAVGVGGVAVRRVGRVAVGAVGVRAVSAVGVGAGGGRDAGGVDALGGHLVVAERVVGSRRHGASSWGRDGRSVPGCTSSVCCRPHRPTPQWAWHQAEATSGGA